MTQNDSFNNNGNKTAGRAMRIILSVLLAVSVIAGTIYVAQKWVRNPPRSKRKPREVLPALVEVAKIAKGDHSVTVDAMGTVIPARSLDLAARVSGEIVRVSTEFFPGGRLYEGDLVVEIDKKDYRLLLDEAKYTLEKAELSIEQSKLTIEQSGFKVEQSELAIEQRKADIIKAEKDLALELGQQKIAKREYEVLGETINEHDEELVLRKPQLRAAEAAVASAKARLGEAHAAKKSAEAEKKSAESAMKSAEAERSQAEIAIEKAQLNLSRTDVTAPFNAVIQSRKTETGSQVSAGAPLVTIVDSDEYWIQVAIPVDRLKWIEIPTSSDTKGSAVRIYNETGWGKGVFRHGTVKRLMTEVEAQGRMARLLVSVKDPLSLEPANADLPQMILGSYLAVEIEGSEISDVVRIPRAALRDQNRVWLIKTDNTLDVREVNIVWSDSDYVYVSNDLHDDELLITSDLPAPVQGMQLRLLKDLETGGLSTKDEPGSKATGEEK